MGTLDASEKVPNGRVPSILPVGTMPAMGTGPKKPPHFLREWRVYRGLTQEQLGERVTIVRSAISKMESGENPLMESRLKSFADALGIKIPQLFEAPPEVVMHKGGHTRETVVTQNRNQLGFVRGKRTDSPYEALTERVYLIGRVQAGAWMEAYELPEQEWEEMPLLADPRYPGIQRYALRNVGESMNEVCDDGGIWVFVRFADLTGQGPQPGNYVIVERRRDGLTEATCKQFRLSDQGKPGLYPCSRDPGFKPIPMTGGDPDHEQIIILGRVTDILNRK